MDRSQTEYLINGKDKIRWALITIWYTKKNEEYIYDAHSCRKGMGENEHLHKARDAIDAIGVISPSELYAILMMIIVVHSHSCLFLHL